MSKRSDFEKIEKDYYPTTDKRAIPPRFLEFIADKTYAEPCSGEGDLIELIGENASCEWKSDIEDRGCGEVRDALSLTADDLQTCDLIITNPPFTKNVLLPMIDHLVEIKPLWLLLPADLMHNKYFGGYMIRCSAVISVGRIKWFKESKYSSTDNFCWYMWDEKPKSNTPTIFYGKE